MTRKTRFLSVTAGAALAAGAVLLPLSAAQASPGQTVMPDGATELATALAGPGITVSNATYTGAPAAAGLFSGFGPSVGIDSGVVLSTGTAADSITGPNDSDDTSSQFGNPGDSDLDEIVAPDPTRDAAVLEFDFVPEAANIQFTYVFGSEEYNEYVNQYNDVFALYVNGQNCALIGDTAVSINSVNLQANPSFYVNNDLESGAPHDTELDGFTVPLTCVAAVAEGEVNTLKLAVADTRDDDLDSVVMIQAGSITVNNPPVADDKVVTTVAGTAVGVTLTGTDPEGVAVTPTVATQPANGTLSGSGADLVYTPNAGFTGTDTFTYTVSDGVLTSAPATVLITVTPAPVVAATTPVKASLAATGAEVPWAPIGGAALALLAGGALVAARRLRPAR